MKLKTPTCGVARALFASALLCYVLLNYGGTRSPDSEIVYRTAQALAQRGSFALTGDLELWPGFGVAAGLDEGKYSVFGPGQAIIAAPLILGAEAVNKTAWYRFPGIQVPVSHYCGAGMVHVFSGIMPADVEPHAARFLVSFMNPVVTALAVLVFFKVLLEMTGCLPASGMVAALFAFGSPMIVYSGTFFSEPLATFFCLLSFLYLYRGATRTSHLAGNGLLSGLFLGMAVTCHISAILFAPFFAAVLFGSPSSHPEPLREKGFRAAAFALGMVVPLLLLLYFNFVRFGSPLETGRGIGNPEKYSYGKFMAPWAGLSGLLWSAGKGLAWYSPLSLLGIALWGRLVKANRVIGWSVLAALVFRLLFIASRTDWHGGFSLGPRLMVMATPFFLLPIAFWAKDSLLSSRKGTVAFLAVILVFAAGLQVYFSVGEVFSYYHVIQQTLAGQNDIFLSQGIYHEPVFSPIFFLLNGLRGPFSLQRLEMSNFAVWLMVSGLFAGAAILWSLWMKSLDGQTAGIAGENGAESKGNM